MILLVWHFMTAKPPLRSAVKSRTTEFYFTNHVLTGPERLCDVGTYTAFQVLRIGSIGLVRLAGRMAAGSGLHARLRWGRRGVTMRHLLGLSDCPSELEITGPARCLVVQFVACNEAEPPVLRTAENPQYLHIFLHIFDVT
jgi:hypothetical protein